MSRRTGIRSRPLELPLHRLEHQELMDAYNKINNASTQVLQGLPPNYVLDNKCIVLVRIINSEDKTQVPRRIVKACKHHERVTICIDNNSNMHGYTCTDDSMSGPFQMAYAWYGNVAIAWWKDDPETNERVAYKTTYTALSNLSRLICTNVDARENISRDGNPRVGQRHRLEHVYRATHLMSDIIYRIQLPAVVDEQYYPGELPQAEEPEPPCTDIDETTYQLFKRIFPLKYKGGVGMSGVWTGKTHGAAVRDLNKIHAMYRGEDISWKSLTGPICYGMVSKGVKSNGKRRNVYPMSPKLNAYVTQTIGEQDINTPKNIKLVSGPCFDFSNENHYTYDVKGCDKVMLPYFKRLVKECIPRSYRYIFAKIRRPGMKNIELPQFPSGICCFMRYATSAFACAVANAINPLGNYQIQGDGIVSDVPLNSTMLRANKKYNINGFDYSDGTPRFSNGRNKLMTPIVKGENRITGKALWHIRRNLYIKVLNAKVEWLPERDDDLRKYYDCLDTKHLVELCCQLNIHVNHLRSHPDWKEIVSKFRGVGTWRTVGWEGVTSVGVVT